MLSIKVNFLVIFLLASCGGGDQKDDRSIASDVVIYSSCGNSPNYSTEVTLLRWKKFPLTVYIDLSKAPNVNIGNNRIIYQNGIEYGVRNWSRAGNGIGQVNIIPTPDADIVVRFATTPTDILGVTNHALSGKYIVKGTIIDLSLAGFGNLSQTVVFESSLKDVVTHEMGHALLGLGHPRSSPSVMGSFSLGSPTSLDINTIREAYCK